MKKLMIAAAIVCATVAAQAATYNWSGRSDWISADGSHGLAGKQVYMFNVNDIAKSALLEDLTMANIEKYALVLSSKLNYATTAGDGDFMVTGKTGGYVTDLGKGGTAYAYALILDTDTSGNTWAYAIDSPGQPISDGVVGGQALAFTFEADNIGAAGAAGWTMVQTVPEPTSGLLLILGMAGLMLKRKRA